MTEKRFTLEEFGLNFIVNDNGRNLTARKTVDLLNELAEENQSLKSDRVRYEEECRLDIFKELHEENERLKRDNTNLHRTMSRDRVRYAQFRDKVFCCINKKIKLFKDCCMSNEVKIVEDLKKEIEWFE